MQALYLPLRLVRQPPFCVGGRFRCCRLPMILLAPTLAFWKALPDTGWFRPVLHAGYILGKHYRRATH